MKLGYFSMPLHPPGMDFGAVLQQEREAVLLLDKLGYYEAFFGEHTSDAAERITSSLIFIAMLAPLTKGLRLGTGVLNLPYGHPAALAGQIAMVDHLLGGRFILGVGPGGIASDVEVYEKGDSDRLEMFVECLEHILAIWEGEPPYDIRGKYWNISTATSHIPELGLGVLPKPFQRPHPEIAVSALAPFSKGVSAAAARGWNPITSNFLQTAGVASHWQRFCEGCADGGRVARGEDWRVVKFIFVTDDPSVARSYAKGSDGPYHYNVHQIFEKLRRTNRLGIFKATREQKDEDLSPAYVVDKIVVAGTPDKVADELLAFREDVGPFGTLLYGAVDWLDEELGKRSIQLMAEEVMPRINDALGDSSNAGVA